LDGLQPKKTLRRVSDLNLPEGRDRPNLASKTVPSYIGGLSLSRARELQIKIARMTTYEDNLPSRLRYVAGADAAYAPSRVFAAISILDYPTLSELEVKTTTARETFPYIPTLLSLREAPALLEALRKAEVKPDVLLVDGHGSAHPYRCGLATYIGVKGGIPTIGVAKSLLWGEVDAFDADGRASIRDDEEVIGAALNTPIGKPIYVSVGSHISLERAVQIVRHCTRGRRLPEPLQRAHLAANLAMKESLRRERTR
jgi:deoxyribonuclease V